MQANAYDDEATGEVVVDIIRVPKLYLTDTKGRTGNPIWCVTRLLWRDWDRPNTKQTLIHGLTGRR